MKRNRRHATPVATVILGLAAVLRTLALPTVQPAAGLVGATSADMVIEWNANAQVGIIGTASRSRLSPTATSRWSKGPSTKR